MLIIKTTLTTTKSFAQNVTEKKKTFFTHKSNYAKKYPKDCR